MHRQRPGRPPQYRERDIRDYCGRQYDCDALPKYGPEFDTIGLHVRRAAWISIGRTQPAKSDLGIIRSCYVRRRIGEPCNEWLVVDPEHADWARCTDGLGLRI